MKKSEIHLFILWERALEQEVRILDHINNTFTILARYRVHWRPAFFSSNLTRFYGKKLPSGSFKEEECGRGPFLLILVEDSNPKLELRTTSHGDQLVNTNLFDAKQLYRQWTGGGHKIHATNTETECDHDLALLLGHGRDKISPSTELIDLKRELSGAEGWANLNEFFEILNLTTPYLVLRNFEQLPEDYYFNGHNDIDLLVADREQTVFITNAQKVHFLWYRAHYLIKIANQEVAFDFRSIADNYYDQMWASNILANRIKSPNGFYIPDLPNYFYSLLYHALIHKPSYSADYQNRLQDLAKQIDDIDPENMKSARSAYLVLENFLQINKYCVSDPKDLSVFLNPKYFDQSKYNLLRKLHQIYLRLDASLAALFNKS